MDTDQIPPCNRRHLRLVKNNEPAPFGVPAWLTVLLCIVTAILCTVSFALGLLIYATR